MKSFAEFFAGAGLVREGLSSYGWKCKFANDISTDKRDVYVENFGFDDFNLCDVWDFIKNPEKIPNVFLYTASFPCTDLTVAGMQAGLAGRDSSALNAIFEIIRAKKENKENPKVVMLENVRGFLTSHKGNDIRNTIKLFNDLGYHVELIELDALYFSAQSRPRVFLIAVENDLAIKYTEGLDDIKIDKNSLRSKKIVSVIKSNSDLVYLDINAQNPKPSFKRLQNIIDETVCPFSELWWNKDRKNKFYNQMNSKHQAILKKLCNRSDVQYATAFRRMRNGMSMAELRADGYAGCLRTPRGGSSKQMLIQGKNDEWSIRLLTPRECARLQGLRDSYKLPSQASKGYFAMGDAVCVPVIEYIAKEILSPIYSQWK